MKASVLQSVVHAVRLQQVLWNNPSYKKWRRAGVCANSLVERRCNLNGKMLVSFNGNTECHTGQGGPERAVYCSCTVAREVRIVQYGKVSLLIEAVMSAVSGVQLVSDSMSAVNSVQLVSDNMSHIVLRRTILKAQDIIKKVIRRRIFL